MKGHLALDNTASYSTACRCSDLPQCNKSKSFNELKSFVPPERWTVQKMITA